MRFWELKQKEVVNCRDGCRIGFISDLIFDECSGQICQFIIPGAGKFCGCLGKTPEYCICYSEIVRIGGDVVIVDVDMAVVKERCKLDKKRDKN